VRQFGTTTAVYNKLAYNSRSQLAEIRVSTSYTDSSDTTWNRGKIINDYGSTDNNGNLKQQTVYVPLNDANTSSTSWYQQYGYDALNRVTQVHEYTGNKSLDWQQAYTYDRYGNRLGQSQTYDAPPTNSVSVDAATNRITGSPYAYDANGNMRQGGRRWQVDPFSPIQTDVKKFDYGSLNRVLSIEQVDDPVNGTGLTEVSRYQYDAGGNRIVKIDVQNEMKTYFFRDASGQELSEFRVPAQGNPTVEWTNDYVYLAGRLFALKENLRPAKVTALRASTTQQQRCHGTCNWLNTLTWNATPDAATGAHLAAAIA